jgi:DNA polymerase-3 subunit beta
MELKDFKEIIIQTVFCAPSGTIVRRSPKETLAVFLEKNEGRLIMAATNNRRLGFASRVVGNDFPDFDGLLVPAEVLQKIAKRKRDTVPLSISVTGKEVNFHIGSACFPTMALPGESIKFHRNPEEISQIFPFSFTVDRSVLIEALGRVSIMLDLWRWNPTVYLDILSGTLGLHTSSDEYGSAEHEIPCGFSGEKAELTLHARYFMEILEHIDTERIKIRFGTRNATVVVLPEPERDYHYFLAQIRRD